MTVLRFLHTSPVHVDTFDALLRASGSARQTVHAVDESLLSRARQEGPEAVEDLARDRLHELVAAGAGVVCCTCSTIGGMAEAADLTVPVVRVDRPMAARAVRVGSRIGVVAALESTLAPTRALLAEEAERAGITTSVHTVTVRGAWDRFEAGDHDGYTSLVSRAARELAPVVDVVVLAQASMAAAEARLTDLAIPALSSPRIAVDHLVTMTSLS